MDRPGLNNVFTSRVPLTHYQSPSVGRTYITIVLQKTTWFKPFPSLIYKSPLPATGESFRLLQLELHVPSTHFLPFRVEPWVSPWATVPPPPTLKPSPYSNVHSTWAVHSGTRPSSTVWDIMRACWASFLSRMRGVGGGFLWRRSVGLM